MRTSVRRLAPLPAAVLAALLTVAAGAGPAAADDQPVPGPGTTVAAGAPALPKDITATSFLVADLDTGEILAAKDAHHRLLPASTLKVLTALTLIPRIARKDTVVPTWDDVAIEGSRVGLLEKVKYPAYQVFRAMLMTSGNDAANALATASGGEARTAELMNEEAARIGATETHAVNPSGLDAPGQTSTAYDLALIGRAAMQLPDFRMYVGTKRSTILGRMGKPLRITTHDKLLFNYDGAIGIKNGYTVRAGATYIGAATRNGHSILVTEMHAKARIWPEVASLLDWGFAAERAGATPVGQLHQVPVATPEAAPPASRTTLRPSAARSAASPGIALLPLTLVALTAGGTALAVVRRRRRHRGRPRLDLPL